MRRDPYRVLGISPGASSEELHDAYRRLVKLHHPDRNGGSEESAQRFAEIQEAYEEVRARPRPLDRIGRRRPPSPSRNGWRRASVSCVKPRRPASTRGAPRARPPVSRFRSRPRTASARSSATSAKKLADPISERRRHPAAHRVSELIDDVVSRLDGRRPRALGASSRTIERPQIVEEKHNRCEPCPAQLWTGPFLPSELQPSAARVSGAFARPARRRRDPRRL